MAILVWSHVCNFKNTIARHLWLIFWREDRWDILYDPIFQIRYNDPRHPLLEQLKSYRPRIVHKTAPRAQRKKTNGSQRLLEHERGKEKERKSWKKVFRMCAHRVQGLKREGKFLSKKSYPNWRVKVIHTNKSPNFFYPEELSKKTDPKLWDLFNLTL